MLEVDQNEGITRVHLDGNMWTYAVNGKKMKGKFDMAFPFENGLGRITVCEDISDHTIRKVDRYIDKNEIIFDYDNFEDAKMAQEIYYAPEKFLDIPTETFITRRDLVPKLANEVRRSLLALVKGKTEIDDECVAYCSDLLDSCKAKVEMEKEKVEKSDKLRSDLIGKINDFEM